jgi:hypothetical protein
MLSLETRPMFAGAPLFHPHQLPYFPPHHHQFYPSSHRSLAAAPLAAPAAFQFAKSTTSIADCNLLPVVSSVLERIVAQNEQVCRTTTTFPLSSILHFHSRLNRSQTRCAILILW